MQFHHYSQINSAKQEQTKINWNYICTHIYYFLPNQCGFLNYSQINEAELKMAKIKVNFFFANNYYFLLNQVEIKTFVSFLSLILENHFILDSITI